MELLTPLDDYIRQKNALSRQEIIQLGIDLCKALAFCQNGRILHRDIKPGNIFVSERGDFKLGDFGTAQYLDRASDSTVRGTYAYMAPEVYRGEGYGFPADLYCHPQLESKQQAASVLAEWIQPAEDEAWEREQKQMNTESAG